jgi:hypothetical protein
MAVEVALPAPKRDLRLDLFRGLANWAMFLGHIPGTLLTWLSMRNYGFSDGADLFVFISGYTSALVFGRKMLERGFIIAATRLIRRVWQIYAAHILLFVFYLASVHFLAYYFHIPYLVDQFNVTRLMDFPGDTLTQGIMLRYMPLNLDVLPLYVVLMSAFAPVLWLMLRFRNWTMLGSISLYLAARQFGWNLPSDPSGVWYFNPFAWQLLFVLGAWLALGGASMLHFLVRSRPVVVLGIGYLVFAAAMTLSVQFPELERLFPRPLFEAFNPNDKTNLAFYRVLHLAVLSLLVVRFIPVDAPGLGAAIWRPLVKCGQQSLEVFCVGIYLSFVGTFILETTSDGLFSQLLVGVAGLFIMTAVAYYRSWSKRIENPALAHLDRASPRAIGEHLPAQPGARLPESPVPAILSR